MGNSPENWGRVKELFEAALEFSPEQRSAYLRENESDEVVRQEVERLLDGHDGTGGFLPSPAFEGIQYQPTHQFSAGEILAGRFQIVRFIAAGGMGEVYEARDLELRETLALKTIKREVLQSSSSLERFKREVHLARRVTHPNVCRVFDLFRHKSETNEEIVFVSMELLRGEPLSERIRSCGRFTPQEAMPLIEQISGGLTAAHRVGIVHRDFKPGNVVLVPDGDSGQVRAAITDFGLAFRSGGDANLTTSFATTRGIQGTPAYMAPEQIEGSEVTSAADIYALGLVIYEMVTGALPFNSEPILSMMLKRMREPMPSPRLLVPNLDSVWESAILRCLERSPADRFHTVEELVRVLENHALPVQDALDGPTDSQNPSRDSGSVGRTTRPAGSGLKDARGSPGFQSAVTTDVAIRPDSNELRSDPTPTRKAPVWVASGIAVVFLFAAGVGYRLYIGEKSPVTANHTLAATGERPAAAVLPFENVGTPDQAWLGTALSEMLTTELSTGERVRMISGEDVARTETDLSLGGMPSYSTSTLQRIRANLGCDYVVGGSFLASGNRPIDSIRVDLRLQETQSGETILSFTDSGTISEMPDLMKRIGATLRDKLGVQVQSEAESVMAKASMPSNSEAMRLYADGLTKLRMMDAQGARADLQKTVSLEPLFALGHDALAEAWQFLGYDGNAQQEAKLAVDLSGGLSQPDRKSIEARYRKMTAEWDKAIEIYRSLWGVYDDDPDYALELASVQTSAGKGHDALATLLQLQSRPIWKDDPRIDLGEAFAAESLSDIKLQQRSAARAAQEATSRGARLLAAQAYWQDCAALLALGDLRGAEAACRQGSQSADYDGGEEMKARNLTVLSSIMKTEGQESEAMELREEALRLARQIGSRKDIIGALMNLADLQAVEGKTADAQKNEQEAIGIAREIGDKRQLVGLESNFAADLSTQGDYEQARAFYEDALQTARELGDQGGISTALQNLGALSLQTGDLSNADKDVLQGLAISQGAHLQSITGGGFSNLGDVQMAKGEAADARKDYEDALKLFKEIGDQADTASAELSLAKLDIEEENASGSVSLAGQAIMEFQAEKLIDNEADARNTQARALLAQGKLPEAMAEAGAASKLAVQDRSIKISIGITAARIKARNGKIAEAQEDLDSELAESTKAKLVGSEFEIRLAAAEMMAISNPKLAAASLKGLGRDANASGYLRFADKAERMQNVLAGPKSSRDPNGPSQPQAALPN